jgi:hypothetical protein
MQHPGLPEQQRFQNDKVLPVFAGEPIRRLPGQHFKWLLVEAKTHG